MNDKTNTNESQTPLEFINSEISWMMKRDDVKPQLAIVRLLKVELDEQQRNSHNEPTQVDFMGILKKQLKKLKDEKEAFAGAGRDTENIDKQIAYVQMLLPDMTSPENLKDYIHDYIIDNMSDAKKLNIGAIMAALNAKFGAAYDKGLAAKLAKEELNVVG